VPEGTEVGDLLRAYVHLDSEDRPVATLRTPRLARGEVAFLEVRDVGRFGAFVDWGLTKDLLVPHAEQTRDLAVGDRHPIGLYLDSSGRLAGTMKIREMLDRPGQRRAGSLPVGSWVEGEAWRKEPEVGVFVILERRFLGLVPAHEPTRLRRGEAARFRVTHVLPDGKIELSLRGLASEELASDGERVVAALLRPGGPRLGDRSPPDVIERETGLSKKAFKRAVGRLLKEGRVTIADDGTVDASRGDRSPR
jgi:predicted RNA-binding protein (virulence factor B family)